MHGPQRLKPDELMGELARLKSCRNRLEQGGFQPLRLCCEAYSRDVPTRHLFRHFLNMATPETFCCRVLRSTLPENSLRIQEARTIPIARVRRDARTCASDTNARHGHHVGACDATHQGRLFAYRGCRIQAQRRSLAERFHGSPHS